MLEKNLFQRNYEETVEKKPSRMKGNKKKIQIVKKCHIGYKLILKKRVE